MSLFRSRFARVLIGLSGVALLAAAVAAPSAHAATVARTAACSLPLIGLQPVTLTLTHDLPSTVVAGSSQAASSATVTLDWGSGDARWSVLGAASASGTVKLPTTPHALRLSTVPVSFSEPTQTVSGSFPAYTAPASAGTLPWAFGANGLELTLRLLNAAGQPLEIVDPEYAPDTDDDPSTTNVRCAWTPSTTDPVFHTTTITETQPPAQVTRNLTCSLPLGATAPARLRLSGFPTSLPLGQAPQLKLDGSVEFATPSDAGTLFTTVKARTIEGSATMSMAVRLPRADTESNIVVPGPISRTPIGDPVSFAFTGSTPGLLLREVGTLTYSLGSPLYFNVILRDADGEVVPVPNDGVDPDQDPATTRISCAVAPTEERVIALISVGDVCLPGSSPCELVTPPANLTARPSDTSAELAWTSAEGNLKHFDVGCGSSPHFFVTEPKATITGLTPGQTYTCEVRTVTDSGITSEPARVTFSAPIIEWDTQYAWKATGVVAMKSLASGTLPLTGSLNLGVGRDGGISSGELKLDPVRANLRALGFIPVSAKFAFENTGAASGSLVQAKLTLEQRLRVKLQDVRVFGVQLVAGIPNCQTRSASTIKLASDTPVSQTGGSLFGTFPISNLSGCGGLTGLVSSLTSSTGNTIRLALKP